jgi:thimet oligopeptidase
MFAFRRIVVVVLLCVANVIAQDLLQSQPPLWASKPDAAAFERMENDRLAAAQRAIDAIVAVKGARTIENTLAPYDQAIERINAANNIAQLMQQVHPDADFRDRATAMVSKASAALTALSLNRAVYDVLANLDVSEADSATRYYVQRQLLEFRLAGVGKDDSTRARLKQLNERLTDETSAFGRNISEDQRTIEVTNPSDLDGLPEDYISLHKPGPDGKIRITTNYPDFFPVMTFAKSDDLRRRAMAAFLDRAYPKNRAVLKDMMATRYQIAGLLGYSSWAEYNAADKMVGTAGNIAKFIEELDAASHPSQQKELAMLLAEKQKTHPGATEIWDYENWYYPELVRRSQYNFDSQSVRPYFPYEEVKQGVLDTAARFFNVSFRQEQNVPAWDPSVETWDVLDRSKVIGRFYLDMHPRPGKYSHAAMFFALQGVRGKQLPEAALVCNLPAPTAGDPGLNDYEDVETFFHEFGHLMHWILAGQQPWAGISGISMEWDFVEAPSQMLEELLRSPQVLASFAHHYKSGEAIPAELVRRMNRASTFLRAAKVAQQDGFSAISYDMYKANPDKLDPDSICDKDFHRYFFLKLSPDTAHFYASFDQLAGYSSAYYTYMWDKVIAEDFFAQFDPDNPLAGDAPMRYRHLVLEPGGSMSANDLVKNFLGRPQNTKAFERWMGEEFQSASGSAPAQ